MSVMTNFTVRSLAKNRVRTIVSVVGIALSCALITAIFTTLTSLNAGLYQRTLESEGSWQIYASDVSDTSLDSMLQSDRITDMATYEELGSAAFSDEERNLYGGYLTVKTAPAAVKGSFEVDGAPLTLVPAIEEGRMPQAANEIALPTIIEGETLGSGSSGVRASALQLGSEIVLDLGERIRDDAETGEPVRLDSTISYTDPEEAEKYRLPEERLENTAKRTYTVVGFYSELGSFYGNDFTATGAGLIGITAPSSDAASSAADNVNTEAASDEASEPASLTGAYAFTQGFKSVAELQDFTADLGLGDSILHNGLLRYQGITDGRAVYDSVTVIAATLAVVIAAAGVSLIYNSFAISVAERTRQFGMLSSIGASKRQLRRSVLFEALVLGAVGIPLGIALGVAGVAVTLHFTADALGNAISLDDGIPFAVSPLALAGCALFSLVILLVSAWIPALRASRVSAVDAIRQTQDVRLTRRALRRQRKEVHEIRKVAQTRGMHAAYAGAGSFDLHRGIAGRIFGIPGVLAKRSRERASSRGRTVVASLAMSVLLLIVCGSVKLYMDPFLGQAENTNGAGNDTDILANFSYDAPTWDLTSDDLATFASAIDELEAQAQNANGIEYAGTVKQGEAKGFVPASLLDPAARELYDSKFETETAEWVPSAYTDEGDYVQQVTTFYLDDATFDALAQNAGVDTALFDDPSHPKALGLNAYRGQTNDGRYFNLGGISDTGTLTLYDLEDDDPDDAWDSWGLTEGEDGTLQHLFLNVETGEIEARSLAEDTQTVDIKVVGILDDTALPAALYSISATSHYPVIIMPESVSYASAEADTQRMLGFTFANALFNADDHTAATQLLKEAGNKLQSENVSITLFDNAASGADMRMLAQAIQLFVLLFSVITALVAVANVFNTLTNSIILRTHEFAVLKSVGMGKRAFAKMLACECAEFAVKGFLIGFALAAAATYVIYYGSSFSFASIGFTMPWAYVAVALGVTLAILGISVAFALHKAQAGSIVEALRAEAM